MAKGQFDYKTYLASREWALKREQVRERSGNHCEHCFKGSQQAVHHLTYKNIGNESLDDLRAICNPCHEFLSGKREHNPLNDWAVVSEEYFGAHLIIPLVSLDIPIEVPCTGTSCLWCNYIYPNWGHWFRMWWLRQEYVDRPVERTILNSFVAPKGHRGGVQ